MEASRLRGICHADAFVEQDWRQFPPRTVTWGEFSELVLRPWCKAVERWGATRLRLERCWPPPRPFEERSTKDMSERGKALVRLGQRER